MKSITIHNIDDELVQFIEEKASEWDISLNKTIKRMLGIMSTGTFSQKKKKSDQEIIKSIAGSWTQEDYEEFEKSTEWSRKIDEDQWN